MGKMVWHEHLCPDWVGKAVYGLPESLIVSKSFGAQLVANPGCYQQLYSWVLCL